jgi:ATP-dependent Clp protease ATP-binding subunit ClpA
LCQPRVDAIDALPSLDELAALVRERASDDSPAARLRVAIETGQDLSDVGDALIERFVSDARAVGLSWTEIGQLFGTSKQAAQKRYGPTGTWPGRWTPAAHRALTRAEEDARELGRSYVGTEHLLLGLLAGDDDLAVSVLVYLGVTREGVLATSCMKVDSPDRTEQECLAVMPRLKQALENAGRIAERLGQRVPGTEHLLAGVVGVPGALALELLKRSGVRAADVREELAVRLDVEPELLILDRRRRRRLLAKAS